MLLLLFAAIGSTAAATVGRMEDRVHPMGGRARVAVLADAARTMLPADRRAFVVTTLVGLATLGITADRRRRELLAREGVERPMPDTTPGTYRVKTRTVRVLPAEVRDTLRFRTTFSVVGWSTFAAIALTMTLYRPAPERGMFVAACLALLAPARLLLRYRRGEAEWALWLLVLAPLALLVSRSLVGVATPLAMGLLFHAFARVEEWLIRLEKPPAP